MYLQPASAGSVRISCRHSTETALLRVMNDLLIAVDDNDALMLTLDSRSAFDTIDYSILLLHLELTFGIKGVALQGFSFSSRADAKL